MSDSPLYAAADLLESVAIGDEDDQREHTIARLVLHSVQPYADAPKIAREALFWAEDRGDAGRISDVRGAVVALRIDIAAADPMAGE